jgi:hypothetical protein
MNMFLITNIYGQSTNDKVVTSNITTSSPAPDRTDIVIQPQSVPFATPTQSILTTTNPQLQQQQIPDTGNQTMNSLLAMAIPLIGAGVVWLQQNKKTEKNKSRVEELEEENTKLREGLNRSAEVQTQTVTSIRGTDYTDQDIMSIFCALLDQLKKVGVTKEVIEEKLKTTPTDLILNNRSIYDASQQLLTQIISDNNEYYKNLTPTPDDTCANQYVRSLSMANKMTKNG